MKKNLRYFMTLLLVMVASVGWGQTTITDVLNQSFTGVTGTNYADWSKKTAESGAVYAGNSAGSYNSIQLRTDNNNSGVVSTTSGGKLKKIVVTWNSATANGRTLNVYGSKNAYTAATDLYKSSKQGSLLGTIVCGKSTELTVEGDYEYVGLRSASGAMYLTKVEIEWEQSSTETPTVAKPTFSPAAGAVAAGTAVTISCATEGATIYYTTDGTDPTTGSIQGTSVTVNSEMTIKAIAVKSGMDNSAIASAAYTVYQPVSGYTIDFESPFDAYADWTFTNAEQGTGAIEAHGGTHYATTGGKASAAFQTKEPVANPTTFTCYVSKESNNTTSSTWFVEVSSDGSSWTKVAEQSATSMEKGIWTEITADLRSYSNVYVHLRYQGSTAVRTVDDISIVEGESPVVTVAVPTFSPAAGEVTQGTDVTITAAEGCVITYTTDGTDPTESTTATTTESNTTTVTVNEAITIKAVAMDASDNVSAVAEAAYTIQGAVSYDTVTLPYSKTFTDNLEEWSLEGDIKWVSNKTYGAVVQGASGTAGEGWLISPIVDLTSATTPIMQFEHTGRYFGTLASEATLWVRSKDDDNWQQIGIPNYFTNNDWTFVTTTINLSDYVGEKVQFAFKYMSTASKYGKWEVKNLSIAEPTDPDAKGQKNNPYTVEEIQAMESTNYPNTKVWVKGYIVGVASSKDALVETITDTNKSNVAISASSSTSAFVPVQLPTGSDVRDGVNLYDNSGNLGKEVLLHGLITTYFQTTGVKETDGYEFTGNSTIITESVDVNSYGIGTYVTTKALDFSTVSSTLKAYYASSQTGSNVVFTLVEGAVPAKTPLLVKGTKGTTTDVPVVASADAIEGNLLVAGTGAAVASEGGNRYNFILNADDNGVVSFYKANGQTVAQNRAYLSLPSDPTATEEAKVNLIFSDEATGINNVNAVENTNEKIFNLAGQQMKSAVKGVYIKNGKKYVK